jgi:hypothetical protein
MEIPRARARARAVINVSLAIHGRAAARRSAATSPLRGAGVAVSGTAGVKYHARAPRWFSDLVGPVNHTTASACCSVWSPRGWAVVLFDAVLAAVISAREPPNVSMLTNTTWAVRAPSNLSKMCAKMLCMRLKEFSQMLDHFSRSNFHPSVE